MAPSRRHAQACFLLLGVVILAYGISLRNGFVWDDNFQVVRNPYVHSNQPLTKVLFTDVWGYMRGGDASVSNYYRPLQVLAYRCTYLLAGLQPLAFHLLSILLCWLACIGAYGIFLQLTKRFSLALAAALIFAVHPIHSEAVLWIAAVNELGCAAFYFFSFWCFLRALKPASVAEKVKPKELRRQTEQRRKMIGAALVSFFLALLWKEMALTLPLMIIAYVALTSTSTNWTSRLREAAMRSLPFWGIVAAYAALRILVLGHFATVQTPRTLTRWQYGLNLVEFVGEYFLRLLFPWRLNAYHVLHPAVSIADPRVIAAAIFLVAAMGLLIAGFRRVPLAAFAGVWIFLTLVPVLNLGGLGLNAFAERYLFIPSLGFVLLLTLAGSAVLQRLAPPVRRNAAVGLMLLIAGSAIAEIWHRTPDWHDDRSFYSATIAASPDASQMRSALGQILSDEGKLDEAEAQYKAALDAALAQDAKAQAANACLGLSRIAWSRHSYLEALEDIDKGLKYADLQSLHVGRGLILLQMGRLDEAKGTLLEVIHYSPYDEVALNGLGVIAMNEGDWNSAVQYFNQAVQSMPTFGDAFNNLGRVYMQTRQTPEALRSFQRATELQPQNVMFRTNYALLLFQAKQYGEARDQFQQILQVDPNNQTAIAMLNRLNQAPANIP